ncbi:hypothetical protein [Streptomyces sp. NPDC051218]|uniref:aromatic-ring hydroxylase C-terminal domain-containing protein n=1 Tax=Streptomyces sp. NPDC051218 TaxID=3365645 RepID=UPI00378ECB3D
MGWQAATAPVQTSISLVLYSDLTSKETACSRSSLESYRRGQCTDRTGAQRRHGPLLRRHAAVAVPWTDRVDVVRTSQVSVSGYVVDALLVRPDGYICWARTAQDAALPTTDAPTPAELVDSLIQWFGQPER